jgi:hypothetical protein
MVGVTTMSNISSGKRPAKQFFDTFRYFACVCGTTMGEVKSDEC